MGEYGDLDLADELMALRAENARLTKERDNALHRAAEYRDECNSLSNENRALRAARAAMGEGDD